MDQPQLETLMIELEGFDSRERVRERVLQLEPKSTKEPLTPLCRFISHIAKPHISGVPTPLFCSEYPVYWPRFKKLWQRLK
jgi:hypothetical protein